MTDEATQNQNATIESSHRFPVGTRVYDKEKAQNTSLVVVDQPEEQAQDRDVQGTGQTVADFNEEYDSEARVATVVFENDLVEEFPEWDSLDSDELRETVSDISIREYDYPEPRLVRHTATLPDKIRTHHELICYQHARLIQLAAGVAHPGFLWKRYQQLRDGEYEMASITKEDKYQLKEDFGVCTYCGEETQTTFDHVIPVSKGGDDSISNQVPACESCNSSKSNKDVIEWCKERDEPVPRLVWGKYLKQYTDGLEEEGKLHDEIPEEERQKWNNVEIQRSITDRIHKRDVDGRKSS